jgi:molecular chaperone GrpE
MRPGLEPIDGPVDTVFRLIDTVQQGIEDILYRQGVEPFAIPDTVFDPRRQRAVATVSTEDPDLNKQVAARHRKGFVAGEKVIRPEVVSVYSLKVER